MNDMTRVLLLFRQSAGRMITNHEIIRGQFFGTKPILEYTGRITDARKEINCTCGKDKKSCIALEHIISVGDNKFIYKSSLVKQIPQEIDQEVKKVDINELKAKRIRLLSKYQKLKSEGKKESIDAKIILSRGLLVRNSIDIELERRRLSQEVSKNLY